MERTFRYDRNHFTLNSDLLKQQVQAVAFSIIIKRKVFSSVISKFSFREIALIAGTSINDAKVCFHTLLEMGLVTTWENNGILYARFENLKAKKLKTKKQYTDKSGRVVHITFKPNKSNDSVVISDEMDYQGVVKALYANIIRNTSNQLLFLQCNANRADLDQAKTIKEIRQAKSLRKKNGVEYWKAVKNIDLGLSYSFLCRKLNVNYKQLSEIIKFGVEHKIFARCVRLVKHVVGKQFAQSWYRGLDDFGCQYAKGDSIYKQERNLYLPIYENGYLGDLARKLYQDYCIAFV